MRGFILLSILLVACTTHDPGKGRMRGPFAAPVRELLVATDSIAADSIERTHGSTAFGLSLTEHCRIFFPNAALNDASEYRKAPLCSSYSDGTEAWDGYRKSVFFKHPSRTPFLNEIVVYTPADTTVSIWHRKALPDTLFQFTAPNAVVLKIFHRDAVHDKLFPTWNNEAAFDFDTLMNLYRRAHREVSALCDSLGMRKEGVLHFTDSARFAQFAPLAFKDVLEITTWSDSRTGTCLQLALMPSRPWEEYYINIDGNRPNGILHYDLSKERYDTVVVDTDTISRWDSRWTQGYNIQRDDLAIWLIYTGPTH